MTVDAGRLEREGQGQSPDRVVGQHGPHHGGPPHVGPRLGPRVPHAGSPILGVEIPAHAPDGSRSGDDRGDGQSHLQGLAERGPNRVTRRSHAHGESQAPAKPRRGQTLKPGRWCGFVLCGVPPPHRALDPPRWPAPEQVERVDHEQRDERGHRHVAGDGDHRSKQPEHRTDRRSCGRRESRGAWRQTQGSTPDRSVRAPFRRPRPRPPSPRLASGPQSRARRQPSPRHRRQCEPATPRWSRRRRQSAPLRRGQQSTPWPTLVPRRSAARPSDSPAWPARRAGAIADPSPATRSART